MEPLGIEPAGRDSSRYRRHPADEPAATCGVAPPLGSLLLRSGGPLYGADLLDEGNPASAAYLEKNVGDSIWRGPQLSMDCGSVETWAGRPRRRQRLWKEPVTDRDPLSPRGSWRRDAGWVYRRARHQEKTIGD